MIQVLKDSREKRPLLFPSTIRWKGQALRVQATTKKMDEGDYCLEGMEDICLIERKAGLREIHGNFFTKDMKRAKKAFDRLAKATKHPILLLESGIDDLLTPTVRFPRPGPLVQRLVDACTERRIEFLLVGRCLFPKRRRQVGELIVRFMLSYAAQYGRA